MLLVGFILVGGRIDDIDPGVSDAANFAFYFVIMWLLLKAISVLKTRRLTQKGHVVNR